MSNSFVMMAYYHKKIYDASCRNKFQVEGTEFP